MDVHAMNGRAFSGNVDPVDRSKCEKSKEGAVSMTTKAALGGLHVAIVTMPSLRKTETVRCGSSARARSVIAVRLSSPDEPLVREQQDRGRYHRNWQCNSQDEEGLPAAEPVDHPLKVHSEETRQESDRQEDCRDHRELVDAQTLPPGGNSGNFVA